MCRWTASIVQGQEGANHQRATAKPREAHPYTTPNPRPQLLKWSERIRPYPGEWHADHVKLGRPSYRARKGGRRGGIASIEEVVVDGVTVIRRRNSTGIVMEVEPEAIGRAGAIVEHYFVRRR